MKKSKKISRPPAAKSGTTTPNPADPFQLAEEFLQRNSTRLLLLLPLLLGTMFALLHFDAKLSEGGDDAMYIEAAWKYSLNYTGYFYTSNAPLYPMLLGVVTLFSGLNLVLFKALNVMLFLLHLAIMFYAFRGRIPNLVLLPVLLLSAVNSYLLYYASQTYTEMLFLCLQGAFLWVFFSQYEKIVMGNGSMGTTLSDAVIPQPPKNFGQHLHLVKFGLTVGGMFFLITLCKNIAIGMVGAVVLFLLYEYRFRLLFAALAGFAVVKLAFEGIKIAVWGAAGQYGSQGSILLLKDAYNPSKGNEDFSGFVARFFGNLDLYTSKRLFQILGFRDPLSIETYTVLSLFVIALVAFAGWRIFKVEAADRGTLTADRGPWTVGEGRGPTFLFLPLIYLYLLIQFFLTYLVLQTSWDQPRLILVYVPLLVMVVLFGFYSYFHTKQKAGLIAYAALATLLVASSFITSTKKAVEHFPVMKKNIGGDKYYGFTPDWENFLRLSEWCADNLPPNAGIASRKAPMSFVYGKGRTFFPVYTVPAVEPATNLSHPDSALKFFNDNNITYILLASLRRNPSKIDGNIINTLHRMVEPIARKYPHKVKLVKQMGKNEPSYLYKLEE